MSRIAYPKTFAKQRELFNSIKKKVDADGINSTLLFFLEFQKIDLTADAEAGIEADNQEELRKTNILASEKYSADRIFYFAPVDKRFRGGFQFLKHFYKPNINELGDWGVKIVYNRRIKYPKDFIGLTNLFKLYKAENDSYPTNTSPLHTYLVKQQINLTADETVVANAIINDNKAKQCNKDSEKATQSRKNKWNQVNKDIHRIGDFLFKLYCFNPKLLGAYGFTINSNKKKPTLQTTSLILSQQKTIGGIVLGKKLINVGKTDILLYKGRKKKGTPVTIAPGESMLMTKGYSVITVVNTSALLSAKFTYLRGK